MSRNRWRQEVVDCAGEDNGPALHCLTRNPPRLEAAETMRLRYRTGATLETTMRERLPRRHRNRRTEQCVDVDQRHGKSVPPHSAFRVKKMDPPGSRVADLKMRVPHPYRQISGAGANARYNRNRTVLATECR